MNSHHEIDLLLECKHILVEVIEAAIFLPKIGDIRFCNKCQASKIISRVGSPYWVDEDQKEVTETKKRTS